MFHKGFINHPGNRIRVPTALIHEIPAMGGKLLVEHGFKTRRVLGEKHCVHVERNGTAASPSSDRDEAGPDMVPPIAK